MDSTGTKPYTHCDQGTLRNHALNLDGSASYQFYVVCINAEKEGSFNSVMINSSWSGNEAQDVIKYYEPVHNDLLSGSVQYECPIDPWLNENVSCQPKSYSGNVFGSIRDSGFSFFIPEGMGYKPRYDKYPISLKYLTASVRAELQQELAEKKKAEECSFSNYHRVIFGPRYVNITSSTSIPEFNVAYPSQPLTISFAIRHHPNVPPLNFRLWYAPLNPPSEWIKESEPTDIKFDKINKNGAETIGTVTVINPGRYEINYNFYLPNHCKNDPTQTNWRSDRIFFRKITAPLEIDLIPPRNFPKKNK